METSLKIFRQVSRQGTVTEIQKPILHEHSVDVFINNILTLKLNCTPSHLEELLTGRLITEGLITSCGQIQEIHLLEAGHEARILLTEERDTGKASKDHRMDDLIKNTLVELPPLAPSHWEEEWIFSLADSFANDTALHKNTFGAHSCFLAVKDEILFHCEDIGRHNALDKAIGWAYLHNIAPKDCILYTSGRAPADMVRKTVRARIPVFISKAVPTVEGIAIAQLHHLSLICSARPDSMNVFTDFRLPQESSKD